MQEPNGFKWKASLIETYEGFIRNMIEIMPQIVGALLLLLLGLFVANIMRILAHKAMNGFDVVLDKFGASTTATHLRGAPRKSNANIVSKIVFWSVLLFFITAASNVLGWALFAGWMDSVIRHLPNLIMGLAIILAGFVAGGSTREAVQGIALKSNMVNAEMLALSFQVVVVLTAVIIGVEQMGVNVGFLTMLIAIIAGIILAGACLAFGLGAQTLVANIIGAQFVKKHCQIGELLHIAGQEGTILEITQTAIVLETSKGRCIVPAKLFQREVSAVEGGN